MRDDLADAADVARDDREPGRGGLDERDRQAFRPRREEDGVEAGEDGRHVLDRSEEVRAARQVWLESADPPLEHPAQAAVADEGDVKTRVPRREHREDLERRLRLLDLGEAADDADEDVLGLCAAHAPDLEVSLRLSRARDREQRREIDARRDDDEAPLVLDHPEADQVVRRRVRHRDDPVGLARETALERGEACRHRLREVASRTWPWKVWTRAAFGTARAARRPIAPAFDACVCTTSGANSTSFERSDERAQVRRRCEPAGEPGHADDVESRSARRPA